MTAKRFNYHIDEVEVYYYVCDNTKKGDDRIILELVGTKYDAMEVCELLNELHKEKESWKGIACNNSNFVSILLHELDIAQEQGYEVSDPFKKLMEERS